MKFDVRAGTPRHAGSETPGEYLLTLRSRGGM
jgi:hypothetical protein